MAAGGGVLLTSESKDVVFHDIDIIAATLKCFPQEMMGVQHAPVPLA